MAGISTGSHTFFFVSPAQLSKAQCFAVKRGEVNGLSFSPSRYAPEIRLFLNRLGSNPTAINPLSMYVDVNPSADVSALDADALVGFIPMQAVSDSTIGEYTVTNRPLKEVRKGYSPFINGDILWAKITPCMQNGKSCVVDELPNGVGFGSTEFHVLRVRAPGILPKFVFEFVSQDTLRRVATYAFTGSAGQQRVPANFLETLPFPKFSATRQKKLVAVMDEARAERKAKLEKTNSLLVDLDDFVLETLGITPPPEDSRRVFAVPVAQLRTQGPINSDYYHPERSLALRTLNATTENLSVLPLAEVVKFERNQIKKPGKNYLGLSHVQSYTGELTDSTDIAKGTCSTYQANDVLFARLRPYLNKVYRAEMNGCCSTEFHVLRVKNMEALMPDYLAAILRSRIVLAQTVHMMTGNTHPRLANDDVANLIIPIPALEVQKTIAAEVLRRREVSRRLRSEAESGWQDAKQWFQKQLLDSPSP